MMALASLFTKQEDILDALKRCKEKGNIIGITLPTSDEILLVTVVEIKVDSHHPSNSKVVFRDYDIHGKLLASNNCLVGTIKHLAWFDGSFDAPIFLKFRNIVFK